MLPKRLRAQATEHIELLDQDGERPGEPRPETNELRITRNPRGGGTIVARYDDPVRFETILEILDIKSAPLTAEDHRTAAERQADALADVFGFVADHGDSTILPDNRPNIAVVVHETDLENRAAAGCLAFGGIPSPEALRRMCCDANVIPAVLDGAGRPIDVGRSKRSIPSWIRRAVQVRDRGCAHPGCDRPRITGRFTRRSGLCAPPATEYPSLCRQVGSTRSNVRVAIPATCNQSDEHPRHRCGVPPKGPRWKRRGTRA
jgi:hypothetical protein